MRADSGRSSATVVTSSRYLRAQPSGQSYLLRLQGLLRPVRTENVTPDNDADMTLEIAENGGALTQSPATITRPAVATS